MSSQVWLPVNGALLKKLREDAGVEITALARMHSLSTAQVKQLEDGGDSAFYTSAIKLATGRKLLMHFGADIAPPEQATEHNQALENDAALDIPSQKLNSHTTTSFDLGKTKRNLRFLLSGVAVVCLGFVFSNVYQSKVKTEPKPEEPIVQTAPMPASMTAAPESKSMEAKDAVITETSSKSGNASPIDCKWANTSVSISGHQPSKSGDYVHAVANSDGVICVKDYSGKLQIVHFKNGQSQTVRGRPPFEIFSHNLYQFKLFYQGNLLKLPSNDIKNITLQEQKYE